MVRRQPDGHRFETPLLRWVVERTPAWFNRRRRQSKDFEARSDASKPWFHVAMLHLVLKMLRPAYVIFHTPSQRRETKGRMAPNITTTLPQFGQFLAGNRFAEGKATKLSSAWAGRHEEVLKTLSCEPSF